ncbi:hypothetical protein HAX54_006831, partial [Datura stramonium]|nr:hypothetical protein [Datura stramonium]
MGRYHSTRGERPWSRMPNFLSFSIYTYADRRVILPNYGTVISNRLSHRPHSLPPDWFTPKPHITAR